MSGRMSSSSMYAADRRQQTWSNQHTSKLRKQRSFIESSEVVSRILCQVSDSGNRTSSRGSAKRSGSLILARVPSDRNKFAYLQKQRSIVDQVCAGLHGRSEQKSKGYSLIGSGGRGGAPRRIGAKGGSAIGSVKVAWTNDTFDGADEIQFNRQNYQSGSLSGSNKKDAPSRSFVGDRLKKSSSCASSKSENKINLSIVLSPTIRATETEFINSDIESSSESVDIAKTDARQPFFKGPVSNINEEKSQLQQEKRITPAAQRRAQFQASRGPQVPNLNSIPTIPSNSIPLSASPSLTIQQRPPLVRAMSAPVRSLDDTTKNILVNNKRKLRRRKAISRNLSCDKSEPEPTAGTPASGPNGKKILSRSRSTCASDVITLVSLISSEGSDSEKEENALIEETQSGRAPSLRRTGKSVSFQENEHPNYQMAVKEFPHMLRRGSIAPLAARLRSNRPPTAPPVSIFLSDYENCSVKMSELEKITKSDETSNVSVGKENNIFINNTSSEENSVDYNFPDYVRSIKERECWKLFQKMSKKGVTVAYDTILRGMLTPTEFRQLQKQRDFENAKAKEAQETESAVSSEITNKVPIIGKK